MLRWKAGQRAVRAGALLVMLLAPLAFGPAAARADILAYGQSFEGMSQVDPGALSSDGWLVFGNVYSPAMAYLYGYGPFPAPNGGPPAFCVLETGQGGPTQGNLQLSVFSDYENADHANGNLIESNVFQEQVIGAGDVGRTWYFEFDAKLGNLAGATTALAFIKTLDPNAGYALTNFISADMTSIPATWDRYSVSLTVTAGLVGQIFQFGFANTATLYEPSGVFYDNIELTETSTVGVPGPGPLSGRLQLSALGNPATGRGVQTLAFSVPEAAKVRVRVFDVSGAVVGTLLDRDLPAGVHQVAWSGEDAGGRAVGAGVYFAEVTAGSLRGVAKLNRLR